MGNIIDDNIVDSNIIDDNNDVGISWVHSFLLGQTLDIVI